ncbi:MAG: Fe2+-dependent dioxygenase [Pseudomonadales bacterium]
MLVVVENFLSAEELVKIRTALASAPWADGQITAGGLAAASKNNQQVDDNSATAVDMANILLGKLGHHPLFVSATIPQRIHPPRFNRYGIGESYGMHVDAPIMSMPNSNDVLRSDVSATVFLSSPDTYDGGELLIEGQFGAQEVKLNAGDMVVYPSSSLHQVSAVTRGERLAAILWVQSMVADPAARALLFDLDQSIQALTRSATTDPDELTRLTNVYHNLARRWAHV